jgi:DNA-binding transcriptional ArsR family regulator
MNDISDTQLTQETRAAAMLSALGNPHRLRVFKLLIRAGEPGLSVGVLQEQLSIPASTLSHHLSTLNDAGLIAQRRDGRTIYNTAAYPEMDRLIAYLTAQCCMGSTQKEQS